ncbi:MAG: helix-turn-helix domain-containing protein [Spirochaetaceae bacterium]
MTVLLLLWIAEPGNCGPISLDVGRDRYSVLPAAEYLQLTSDRSELSSGRPRARELRLLEQWSPIGGRRLPIGYSDGAVWIRFQVLLPDADTRWYYLEVPSAQLKEAAVYVAGPADPIGSAAVSRDFDELQVVRPAAVDLYPVFPVTFDAAGTYTMYIRLATSSYIGTPIYLTTADSYLRARAVREAAFYMLLGGIAFSVAFGFIQLLRSRHSLFAMLLGYLLLMLFGVWTGFGDAARVIWWNRPEIADAVFRPSFLGASASVLYITYRLLRTDGTRAGTGRLVAAGCILVVLLIPFHIITGTGVAFIRALAVVMTIHFAIVATLFASRGLADRVSRNTLIAWAALLFFPLSSIGSRLELLPYSPYTEYAFVLALPVHMFLLLGAVSAYVTAAPRRKPGGRLLTPSAPVDGLQSRLSALIKEERVYAEAGLTEEELARRCNVSRHRLSEYLNRHLGTPFYTFLDTHRIPHACRLLTDHPERSVLEIAYTVGYNSKTTFNRRFKQVTGVSPREYRKQHQKTSLSVE